MMIRNRVHKLDGTTFTVPRQYTDLTTIGKGGFGVVASATNILTNEKVAIKKICNATKSEQETKHVLREIRLMRYLGVHDNIMSVKGLSMREKGDELYVVMECADMDLHRLIQSQQPLTEEHRQYFMFQIIRAVDFIHKHNVIHRDLKPGNILLLRNCRILISDFGLSRERPLRGGLDYIGSDDSDNSDGSMTKNAVTRWYRAPEIMLVPNGMYNSSIDMWSVGCILAEMLGRKPLFPGNNFIDQLTLTLNGIGSPQPQQMTHVKSRAALNFLESASGKQKIDFCCMFPDSDRRATDLLEELLLFDPSQRLAASAALKHEYLETARLMDPTLKDLPVKLDCDFQFENQCLCKEDLKILVRGEVSRYNEVKAANFPEPMPGIKPKVKRVRKKATGSKKSVLSLSGDNAAEKRRQKSTRTSSGQRSHLEDIDHTDSKELKSSKKLDAVEREAEDRTFNQEKTVSKQSHVVRQNQMGKNYKSVPRSPKFSVMSYKKKGNGTLQHQTGQ